MSLCDKHYVPQWLSGVTRSRLQCGQQWCHLNVFHERNMSSIYEHVSCVDLKSEARLKFVDRCTVGWTDKQTVRKTNEQKTDEQINGQTDRQTNR